MTAEGVWELRRGGSTIGIISVTSADFPWLEGTVAPLSGFDEVAGLFAAEIALAESDDDAGWEGAHEAIRAAVQLHYPDGREVPEFLLHIDGDRAWFRWNDAPFAD